MHHLRRCWLVVNWTCRNRPDVGSFLENAYEIIVCNMRAILIRAQCVDQIECCFAGVSDVTERPSSINISKMRTARIISFYYSVIRVHVFMCSCNRLCELIHICLLCLPQCLQICLNANNKTYDVIVLLKQDATTWCKDKRWYVTNKIARNGKTGYVVH